MTDGAPAETAYAELHCHSYFSLLDGASSPEALVARAVELGLTALALTDHDSLAGAVRFWLAARRAGLHAVCGAEVTLADGRHLTLLAENQTGYANLCKLITVSRLDAVLAQWQPDAPGVSIPASSVALAARWPGKTDPTLRWERLAEHQAGLIALTGCRQGVVAAPLLRGDPATARQGLGQLQEIFGGDRLFIELQHHNLPGDDRIVRGLLGLARQTGLPVVATHNVHYPTAAHSQLRDVLTAVRQNLSLVEARRSGYLPFNDTYALQGPVAMQQRFAQRPDALANAVTLAARCQVSLDFSNRRLPIFETPAQEAPFPFLYELCHRRLPECYPTLQPVVLKQLAHELEVIERAGLAGYFLIVWDIVRFAREQGVRCQGRGSAANSIVAYLLGITSVDPLAHHLLFERFLSSDKFTMPDIDIDFAADRREEVIQYVYGKYGRAHTAMVCNVVTYQARSALRDLGKVLELPEETVEQLQGLLDTNAPGAAADTIEQHALPALSGAQAGAFPSPGLLITLLRQIDGCPRHLSIHSGGMLITGPPLDEVVPLEPATMPGRFVCQWDKDSVEDAGLIKIDLLALRTLGMVSEALGYVAQMEGRPANDVLAQGLAPVDRLALDDPEIYRMLQRADTIGTFQVESRAQQQMLPRLKPARFEDIVIEVAIVRPGPIQGGAVHPYLRRRAGLEPVSYLHPSLEPVLAETLGVLLFQEQAIRVAVAAAGFSPGEADLLRRALSRARSQEAMEGLRDRFVRGAEERGIERGTADAIFHQLAGFAGYGFCKSHAASFALIAYQTLWLKRYHAPAFYCALLNQQPMGFYPAEVILGDARRHGVETLPPDINHSEWRYTLVRVDNRHWALRTGFQTIADCGEHAWAQIAAVREVGAFADLEDFCRRTRLPRDVVTSLIRAGACDGFGARRELLWRLGELDFRPDEMEIPPTAIPVALPVLPALEQTLWEYELMGLSPAQQMMKHYRAGLRARGVRSNGEIKQMEAGQRVRGAGFVVVRQRPATARGILFMSLEDESGLLDVVVKPEVYQELRPVIRSHMLLVVEGIVQRNGRAASLLLHRAEALEKIV